MLLVCGFLSLISSLLRKLLRAFFERVAAFEDKKISVFLRRYILNKVLITNIITVKVERINIT
jgi:hypothetical protein